MGKLSRGAIAIDVFSPVLNPIFSHISDPVWNFKIPGKFNRARARDGKDRPLTNTINHDPVKKSVKKPLGKHYRISLPKPSSLTLVSLDYHALSIPIRLDDIGSTDSSRAVYRSRYFTNFINVKLMEINCCWYSAGFRLREKA